MVKDPKLLQLISETEQNVEEELPEHDLPEKKSIWERWKEWSEKVDC